MIATFRRRATLVILVAASLAPTTTPLQAQARRPIAEWRAAHERQIVDELLQFVAIPNVSGADDMTPNVAMLKAMFSRRGFTVEQFDGTGVPVVFASMDVRRRAAC